MNIKNKQQYNNKSFTAHSRKLQMILQCYIRVCTTPKNLNLRCSIPKCLWNKRWEKFRHCCVWRNFSHFL